MTMLRMSAEAMTPLPNRAHSLARLGGACLTIDGPLSRCRVHPSKKDHHMRNFTGIALAATALVALAACDQAPQKAPTVDAAAVEKDLRAIETQWNKDYN